MSHRTYLVVHDPNGSAWQDDLVRVREPQVIPTQHGPPDRQTDERTDTQAYVRVGLGLLIEVVSVTWQLSWLGLGLGLGNGKTTELDYCSFRSKIK